MDGGDPAEYGAELDDLSGRLDEAMAGGTRAPAIFYRRALLAALRDDPTAADAAMNEARERAILAAGSS